MPFFEDYGSDFHLYHQILESKNPNLHLHPHYEMCLIPEACKKYVYVNGTQYTLEEPFMVIYAPFCLHRLNFAEEAKVERFVCYYGNKTLNEHSGTFSFFEPYLNNVATIFLLSDKLVGQLRTLIDSMKNYSADSEEQKLLFLLILTTVLRSGQQPLQIGTLSQGEHIRHIIQYMYEHLAEDISADSVAKAFFISRSKLNKDFQKYTTVTFHQLLLEMRLYYAVFLLREGKHSIRNIAELSGFSNKSYFFTLFKKIKGTTPLLYMKKHADMRNRKAISAQIENEGQQ